METENNIIQDEQQAKPSIRHVIWRCDDGDFRYKPRGQPMREGCGWWNRQRTRKRNGNAKNRWMDTCEKCGRRKSLNAGIIHAFDTRTEAEFYQRQKNASGLV